MVKVRPDRPLASDGTVDLDVWVDALGDRAFLPHPERLRRACEMALAADRAGELWSSGHSSFDMGLEMAEMLADLRVDEEGLIAALLYRAVREGKLGLERVEADFGSAVARMIEGVMRMAAISALQLSSAPRLLGRREEQVENVRKMLVALVDDVRVALLKLAERTCVIRAAKHASPDRRERVAREVFEIYAPLAHRLGIGHLRWELEDLSFRYLEPAAYKRIAALLKERRQARQEYVDRVVHVLRGELHTAGVDAEIHGRPKHIYSIWRKMQQKGVGFDQIYDVHAVRILVYQLRECYAALGVVHALWRHVPHEFDDYIATPKENGYRSIHTAVMGPAGKHLEVQIRTHDMHEEAELGVCAHWVYKGTDATADRSYEEKVAWLRQVLEWQEELGDFRGLGDNLRREFTQDRIYLLTPEGHVIDLAPGATPLDFAYRIHTEVGHRCRAARVDGRIVPLNYQLRTGEQVEILTDDDAEPSMAWLNPNLGFIRTSRARARIQAWFRARDRERNLVDGRRVVTLELERMSIEPQELDAVAGNLGFDSLEELYCAVGVGELRLSRLLRALERHEAEQLLGHSHNQLSLLPGSAEASESQSAVRGAGHRAIQFADCCQPQTGDVIVGEVLDEGGVQIHRRDCVVAQRLLRAQSERLIMVDWGGAAPDAAPALAAQEVRILAYNRAGLLFDVTRVFAEEGLDLLASTTRTDRETSTAEIETTVDVASLEALARVMDRIGQIPNVIDVRRVSA